MRIGAKTGLAKKFRKEMTHAEVLLWLGLKGHSKEGITFRRQHPVGPYILDFYCERAKLAIEVDGESHSRGNQPEKDEARDKWLAELGIETLRIPGFEIMANSADISEGIVQLVRERLGISAPE
ncbi:endonuclease domain-containing protein [Asticcacaulis sp. AC402]|uniref:endonuclease domain-containing protein n=1 Tax=Asticcacaulis sp. AC402 TaxID=1282361 RepID=UPI0003C40AF5|nr:DUF559 domain-containing protein [Asticcacaulis sp. AC402]ESQ76731.1 hypothetical protein ABAC402_03380 [Asticcacaulis sp. AC402]